MAKVLAPLEFPVINAFSSARLHLYVSLLENIGEFRLICSLFLDHMPLRQTTKTALGPRFAVEVSTEKISAIDFELIFVHFV